nr:putative reverse transcriptase domain-containing protein [Tanacetum cinerariifolium]
MLHLLRVEMVINSPWMLPKNWLVQKQTTFDAAKGFEQIIDFLSGSYIHYALTVNPHIYILCIKQFWNTASVKRSDDVTRLQALVDRKKIVISEVVVREILQLDDAEGVVCLPNEEIFAGLAQMGYEKPSTKLTFYKAFFSSQWKFLIHTILQSLSAKRTSWNEFSTAMASAVICLSKGQKFNFSKYIFDSLVRNVDSSSKFYMYPRFIQLIIQNQVSDLFTHTTRFISPALTQKVFANIRRVGKGFSGVKTPLFEGMLAARQLAEEGLAKEQVQADDVVGAAVQENVAEDVTNDGAEFPTHIQQILDVCSALTRRVKNLENDKAVQKLEIIKLKTRVKRLEKANKDKSSKLRHLRKVGASKRVESSDDMEDVFNQGRMIDDLDKDEGIELVKDTDIAETEGRHAAEQAEKQAKIYHLDLDHSFKVLISAASATISAAKPSIPAAAPTIVAAYTRRRKRVIIKDPEEELSSKTPVETPKLKDKGKGILIETPKPMKKNDQIELDAEYARKLHEEINKGMKKRPQTESEARKNMMIYLKNNAGYKMDFFKGMSYDEICPIFQDRFDENMRFLFKLREEMEEEDHEIIKSINETPAQKAAKRRKLNEKAQEAEDLKKRLEVVDDEDDDVFIEATPLAKNVPVVDYQILILLVERRYSLLRFTLEQLVNVTRLQVEEESEMSLELLRSSGNANAGNNKRATRANKKGADCYKCGAQGHFKRECPKLKNKNRSNQDGNGNAPKNCMWSFVSTAFSSLIDITPATLVYYYNVELADRIIIRINTIIRGCTLNFLNHPFNINLMPVELGSFDVIIGMDWLAKYHAVFVCDDKLVCISFGNETLIVRDDESNRGSETQLNIISCTKTQKYMLKGCHLFLAHVTTKNTDDKSEDKRLEDVPIVRDFPEVFLEDLSGLPPTQQVDFQIDLIPGVVLVARAPYQVAPFEMKELSDQLQELSEKGFIRPSSSIWGAPVLFVKKKDGSF